MRQRVLQGPGSAVDPQKKAAYFLLPIVLSADDNNDKISQEFTIWLQFWCLYSKLIYGAVNLPQEGQEQFQLEPTTSR